MSFPHCAQFSTENYDSVSLPSDPSSLQSIPWMTDHLKFVDGAGRTPLHIACDRDDNYEVGDEVAAVTSKSNSFAIKNSADKVSAAAAITR